MSKTLKWLMAGLSLSLSCVAAADSGTQQPPVWPNGAKAAVSLSYDDALHSQLDDAVKALAKHHLKATFYLTLNSDAYKTRRPEWLALTKAGHELGNHTIHHACRASLANREWVTKELDLDRWTVDKISTEVASANQQLQQLDGQTSRTFTPPCGETQGLDGDYLASVAPLFSGVKVLGPPVTSMSQLTGNQLPTWFPVEPTLQQLIDYVEQAATNGTIASITFHGVGAEHLPVDSNIHQQFLAYLAKHQDRFWVETYHNIRLHLQNKHQGQ